MQKLFLLVILILGIKLSFSQEKFTINKIGDIKNYNLSFYDENSVIRAKRAISKKTGVFLHPSLGVSPNFPRAFTGLEVGIDTRYFQFSVGAIAGITEPDCHVFTAMAGYRFIVNNSFIITPRLGYWTIWNGESSIQWTGGNRFIYGLELSKRIQESYDIVVVGYDGRSYGNQQAKFNTIKILTLGIRCYLGK